MKCPYRICVEKRTEKLYGTVIKSVEHNVFETCIEEDCPFYRDDGTRTEPYCARVDNEVGGECF